MKLSELKIISRKLAKMAVFAIVVMIAVVFPANGQSEGQWGISASGAYSMPIGSLSDWFNPAGNYSVAIGQQSNQNWFIEGLVEYSKFDSENLSGYPSGKVDLSLEHIAFWASGRFWLGSESAIRPYFHLAGGVLYWKGVRGEIPADDTISPALPFIPKRTLEEWNWGARTGVGVQLLFGNSLALDAMLNYRFIVGELWPTLQPPIELDGVSGLQTLNFALGLRYYLK